jgi:hypothetical protein
VCCPSPYHWIIHGMFSIHLTKLTRNISQFHVSCIQEMDYRPHFTCDPDEITGIYLILPAALWRWGWLSL